jgi:hypothetical protein
VVDEFLVHHTHASPATHKQFLLAPHRCACSLHHTRHTPHTHTPHTHTPHTHDTHDHLRLGRVVRCDHKTTTAGNHQLSPANHLRRATGTRSGPSTKWYGNTRHNTHWTNHFTAEGIKALWHAILYDQPTAEYVHHTTHTIHTIHMTRKC